MVPKVTSCYKIGLLIFKILTTKLKVVFAANAKKCFSFLGTSCRENRVEVPVRGRSGAIPIRPIKKSSKKMFLSHNCFKKIFRSAAMQHFFALFCLKNNLFSFGLFYKSNWYSTTRRNTQRRFSFGFGTASFSRCTKTSFNGRFASRLSVATPCAKMCVKRIVAKNAYLSKKYL
ncbi:hypothetical protein [Flavobacterium sp.]|uniref:hypothetical protein n=1 Tax=Flavobacterium sp. TaxID=239 RepID=UPI003B98EB96